MSLTINNLDAVALAEAEAFLTEFLAEKYPSLDLSKGRVFYELLIRPAAIFYVYNNANLDIVRNSLSLLTANETPELIDETILDAMMGNLRIKRDDGAVATGQLVVIISEFTPTAIPRLTQFTANGVTFIPTGSFIGVTDAVNVTTNYTRLITQRGDGTYSFTIDVMATTAGADGNVQQGTRFTMSPIIGRVVDIYAGSGFTGGKSQESNAELIAKASASLSPKVACTRLSSLAFLRENFTNIVDLSIVGFGDAEMNRDRDNIFNISTGGKADFYVRTRSLPYVEVLNKECTLVDAGTNTLAFSLTRDEYAGVYEIHAILPLTAELYPNETGAGLYRPASGSLEVTSLLLAHDTTLGTFDFVPAITNTNQAAFSRFQTATVQFVDPSLGSLPVGSKVNYKVYLLKMPDIAAIQDFLSLRSNRHFGSDVLVRAPIPCLCTASISLTRTNNADTIPVESLKTAISDRISSITFSLGQVPVSMIVEAIWDTLGSKVVVDLPVQLTGRIIEPDRNSLILTSTQKLVAPERYQNSVSSRTVAFYLDPADIDIVVRDSSSKAV